jgi:hypothetical protein
LFNEKTLEKISNFVNIPLSNMNIKYPEYPMTDIDDIRLQCLIASVIGCNACIDGVPGITPKKINDFINSIDYNNNNIPLYNNIFNLFVVYKEKEFKKTNNKNMSDCEILSYKKMLNVFIESYLYEPANFDTNDIVDSPPSEN